jgi:hypothetical protein
MRPESNPLIPQFWLWGLDAATGDLNASGFVRRERPSGAGTRSSLYVRDELWLHANGLWLADLGLLYHRGQERFYRADAAHFAPEPPVWLEPFLFVAGLEVLHPIITEYEKLIASRCGCEYRESLLEGSPPFGVRLAWAVWGGWLEFDSTFFDQSHDLSPKLNQQTLQPA